MLQIKDEHIQAILRDPTCHQLITKQLGLPDGTTFEYPNNDSSRNDEIYDAALDVISNSGLTVKSYTAEQDKGPYPIQIIGVEGAYFVWASEYDWVGLFSTRAEAEDYVECNFGEFLID